MKITNQFINFVQKPRVQKLVDYVSKPEVQKRLDRDLPILESGYIAGLYCIDIYASKDIPEPRKNPLAFNSIICFIGGVFIGVIINKLIKPFQDDVIKIIERSNVHKKAHVVAGIKTLVPLISIAIGVRYALPVLATPMSVTTNRVCKNLGLTKLDEEDIIKV